MSVGLVDEYNQSLCVKSVNCTVEATEDFGVFTLKQQFLNNTDSVADASYIFPISDCEIIVDFKVYIGKEVVISHLTKKRDDDSFLQYSFSNANDFSSFKVHIGKLAPGRLIETELKYIKHTKNKDGYCKITIPTVVVPNFGVESQQYSFAEFSNPPSYYTSLDFTYYGTNIVKAYSNTHKLAFSVTNSKVTAKLNDNSSSNYAIEIIIEKSLENVPLIYRYNNIIYCTVQPKIDIYNRHNKRYLFMINTGDKHKQEIKNAIIACLRAMNSGDTFNLMMLNRQNSVFSDRYVNPTDEQVYAVSNWFDSYELGDTVELFSDLISSYKHSGNTVAMLITDEKTSQNEDILRYIENHKSNTYYTLEIDNKDDMGFLKGLAEKTGGKFRFISPKNKVAKEIIGAFNIISAPCITDTVISFDNAVNSIATTGAKKIHYGDKITVITEVYDAMPETMYIDGKFSGNNINIKIDLRNYNTGGSSLRFLFAKNTIDNLSQRLTDCSMVEAKEITNKIVEISKKYSIYNNYMDMLLMNYSGKYYDCVSIIRPKALPYDWYVSALESYNLRNNPNDIDTQFIKLVKRQRSDGSFHPSHTPENSRTKESIAIYTARVISEILNNYPTPALFIWNLRKAVEFLMEYIENADDANIPSKVLEALINWHKILKSNDEISQKVEAIAYMYGNNL